MKKTFFLLLALVLFSLAANSQIHLPAYNRDINPTLYKGYWSSSWVSHPDAVAGEYGVYHFRKHLTLAEKPSHYLVHVSADQRYKLYVNGELASLGPSRGDTNNWNFETVDLAPYLKAGDNILAAVVWNFGASSPVAQMSTNTLRFLVQGNTESEQDANTPTGWKCLKDDAYTPHNATLVSGYFATGATEKVDARLYPWGWEQLAFDDDGWKAVRVLSRATMKGARDDYSLPLVPSAIPPQELKLERLSEVRASEGVTIPVGFLKQPVKLVVPAHGKARLLLDNTVLTTGYFSILLSRGAGAVVNVGFAESLYNQESNSKGNRNEVEGKRFIGFQDQILPDGANDRLFTSLWWRTWRYIELDITTADQPLELNDIYGTYTAYPFERVSTFTAQGHEEMNQMLDMGWRTARLCAHETYMDCPYYEQLQYFGDSRIQTMVTMYNTTDAYLVRRALEFGHESMNADGITMSRYPDHLGQIIPSYALSWIGMCYDYWMYRGDDAYLKTVLPSMRSILAWYEQQLKDDYSLARIPFWYFCDWSAGFRSGEPVREDDGNSAIQDLDYLRALDEVIQMERAFGISTMADHYQQIATKMREGFRAKYWDEGRQLFADTHDHRNFSQHTNALAIIAGITQGQEAKEIFTRILSDESLNQCTIYYRYYLQLAMDKAELGDMLLSSLTEIRHQMSLGLTTMAEQPEPSRSDCHAWGASMNIEFFRMVLGIRSGSAGFNKIIISPSLGELKNVSGSIPHPLGTVSAAYKVGSKLEATLSLPQGTTGTFLWHGRSYDLHAGSQTLTLDI